jgi:hypothetical protein
MTLFLSSLPLWPEAILLVVIPTIAGMYGPVLLRRRIGLDRLISNNEIAGFKVATVGVIYAVLLAFAAIVVGEIQRCGDRCDPRGRGRRDNLPADFGT